MATFNTERQDIMPLFGMDSVRKFNWTIRNIENTTTMTDQSENDKFPPKLRKIHLDVPNN